jgi:hypothetical protein
MHVYLQSVRCRGKVLISCDLRLGCQTDGFPALFGSNGAGLSGGTNDQRPEVECSIKVAHNSKSRGGIAESLRSVVIGCENGWRMAKRMWQCCVVAEFCASDINILVIDYPAWSATALKISSMACSWDHRHYNFELKASETRRDTGKPRFGNFG